MRKPVFWAPDKIRHKNRAVQLQKIVRGLKFWI